MKIFYLLFSILILSCDTNELPKQEAFLRIEFNKPDYKDYNIINTSIGFYYNSNNVKIQYDGLKGFSFFYPNHSMTIDILNDTIGNFKGIENNLSDFYSILDTHSKKSNGVLMEEYENTKNRVFGKLFEIRGDVASPIQFYMTDSISNFISGSLNLNQKSKYDSIYPSIQYIKKDMLVLFETLNWDYKNEIK